MVYLFDKWEELKESLRKKFVFLSFDYDGTLAPIAETPDKAVLSGQTRELLEKLSNSDQCAVAVISGRSLKNIKALVGLKNIVYAGNYGFEIEGPKIKLESPVPAELKSIIKSIYKEFCARLSGVKGIYIEDKGLTVSLHYRLADIKDIPNLMNVVTEVTGSYVQDNKIKINSGKKVYEIKPSIQWDKGKVVLWLYSRFQFLLDGHKNKIFPVYIGDDLTDEEAFSVLKDKGLTIFVGEPGVSQANYYLKDTQEVFEFINKIVELKKL